MKFLVFVFYLNVSKVLVFRRYKANSAHESLEWASSDNLTRKYSGLKCHLEEDPLKFFFKESMHFFFNSLSFKQLYYFRAAPIL